MLILRCCRPCFLAPFCRSTKTDRRQGVEPLYYNYHHHHWSFYICILWSPRIPPWAEKIKPFLRCFLSSFLFSEKFETQDTELEVGLRAHHRVAQAASYQVAHHQVAHHQVIHLHLVNQHAPHHQVDLQRLGPEINRYVSPADRKLKYQPEPQLLNPWCSWVHCNLDHVQL